MIGHGTAGKQVRHGRISVQKSRNRWKTEPDAGASAGEEPPNPLGDDTSGAKRFLSVRLTRSPRAGESGVDSLLSAPFAFLAQDLVLFPALHN